MSILATKLMKYVEETIAVTKVASLDEHGKVWDSEEHMAKEVSELEEKYIGGQYCNKLSAQYS